MVKISPENRSRLIKETTECINGDYENRRQYLNDKEIAFIFNLSEQTIRNLIKEGVKLKLLEQKVVDNRCNSNRTRGRKAKKRSSNDDESLRILMHYMYDNRPNTEVLKTLGIGDKLYRSTIKWGIENGLISEEDRSKREFTKRSIARSIRGSPPNTQMTNEKLEEISRLFHEGHSYKKIKELTGISSVSYWLSKLGLVRSDAKSLTEEQKEFLRMAK